MSYFSFHLPSSHSRILHHIGVAHECRSSTVTSLGSGSMMEEKDAEEAQTTFSLISKLQSGAPSERIGVVD